MFKFKGRINRLTHILGLIIWTGFVYAISLTPFISKSETYGNEVWALPLLILLYILILWTGFSLIVRRIHDFNWSGWLVALIIILPILELMALLRPGSAGTNKYGPPPSPNFSIKNLLGLA